MPDRPTLTRRETVAVAALLALTGTARAQPAGKRAEGIVYEAAEPGAPRRAGDHCLPGVLVSNGREVVRTDGEGRWSLPIGGEGHVFVIKPPGFALPRDRDNIPRFTYLHQPEGTPPELGLRYRGIDPTGPLPASIEFGLTRTAEPEDFEAILFTDPQPESATELDHVRDTAIARVLGTDAAFGLTTGDILFDDLSLYARSNRLIGRVGIPWYHLGGNHDLNFEAPDRARSRETYKRVFGAPTYAFHHGRALFVMLDNVHYLGADPSRPLGAGLYEGRIGERNLAFVANLLAETPHDRLIVVATHIPLVTDVDPTSPGQNTADREALLDLLSGRSVLSIAGHTHTTEHHDLRAGAGSHRHHILTAVSGSWWSGPTQRDGIPAADSRDGTPNGFHLLSVRGHTYTTRYRSAQGAPDETMRIVFESQLRGGAPEVFRTERPMRTLRSPIPLDALASTDVVVNVFDGGPRTRVGLRVGEGTPVPMTRRRRPDPFVSEVFSRYGDQRKPWVKAEPSSHIWQARLPSGIGPGVHRVTVEGEDEYGRPIRSATVLEVTGEVGDGG